MQDRPGRAPMTRQQKLVVLALLAAILAWTVVRSMQSQDESYEGARENACEIIHEQQCVLDQRYDEWVPRSEAR